VRADLTHDTAQVRSALDDVQPSGETALVDGSYAAMVLAQSSGPDVRRGLVIVFTDGGGMVEIESTKDLADRFVAWGPAAGTASTSASGDEKRP
jgi:Mg-chelatase subunit ChlD